MEGKESLFRFCNEKKGIFMKFFKIYLHETEK